MYSTMRLQHKAQDCGTAASLSLRRQCWASDRCCYEYDSHVSGLWASQGQSVVAGEGVAGGMPEVKLQAPAEPYNLFMLAALRQVRPLSACQTDLHLLCMPSTIRTGRPHTHSYNSTHTRTHTHTHMLQLLHLWNSAAVSLFVVVAFIFYELFWQFSAGLRQATHSKGNYRWMNSAHYTPLHFPPHPIPSQGGCLNPRRWLALLCPALLWAGHNFWNVLTCTRLYADLLAVAVLWQICFAHLMWFRLPRALLSLLIFPLPNTSPPSPGLLAQSFVRVVAALSCPKVLFRAI